MRTVVLVALLVGASFERTGLDNYVLLVVDNLIEFLCRHTEQIADFIRQRAEVPDVSYGHNELDVSAALTAYLLLSYLNTASVADNALVADTLVLAAGALIIACRTEDALAEQAVALGLVGAVVDGLRLGNLTIRIFQDLLRRGKTDGNLREIILNFCIFLESHIFL